MRPSNSQLLANIEMEHEARNMRRLLAVEGVSGVTMPRVIEPYAILHSAGPRIWGDVPLLALVACAMALLLSLRLVLAIARSGHL